jgi:ribose-phosphate pyrophosphokinase
MAVFTGNANPVLAQEIARHLMQPLGRAYVGRFSDGETQVELMENVRGRDVFIVQSTCPPANDHLMELLVMADACRRASAARITAVIPYFGYARQDRRPRATRVPITAKLVANMIKGAGVDRVLTVDLHADQIQGFFDIPVDNVYASPVLLGDAWKQKRGNLIVVSPDVGGVVRARALAKRLDDADLAIIDKRRPRPNEAAGDEHHRRRRRQALRAGRRPGRYRRHTVPRGTGAEGPRREKVRPTSPIRCCRAGHRPHEATRCSTSWW